MLVKNGLKLKSWDVVLMIFVLLLAILLWVLPFFKDEAKSAEIFVAQTGKTSVVSLDKDSSYQITSQEINLTVEVENGKIFVAHSDCKDSICRSTPPVSRPGQSIVCAPAGVVIRVLGEGAQIDAVAG